MLFSLEADSCFKQRPFFLRVLLLSLINTFVSPVFYCFVFTANLKPLYMQLRTFFSALLLVSVALSTHAQNTSPYWSLAGNSNAATTSKLGTTNLIPLNLTTNNLTRLKIFENGRVGVGGRVTNSNSPRVLNLADDNAVMRILRVHNSYAPAVEFISRTSADGANVAYWDFYAEPSDKSFRIRDRVTGANLDRLTISNTGTVGIGTTAPVSKLDILGGNWDVTNTEGDLRIGDATYRLKIGVATGGGGAGDVRIRAAGGTNRLMLGAGDALMINGSGNVGINSDPGSYKVKISHATFGINIENATTLDDWELWSNSGGLNLYANSSFRGNFNLTTGAYSSVSDERLKTNIKPMPAVLAKVKLLKPTTYQFKDPGSAPTGSSTESYGFLAQDVNKIFPHLVSHNVQPERNLETYTLDYSGFGVLAIKAIQELSGKVDDLEKQNNELNARIEKLEALLTHNNNATSVMISSAYLEQNVPNPTHGTTTIRYGIPDGATSARLTLTNSKGQLLKTISINGRGTGQVILETSALPAGVYNYTLWIGGREADTKQLVITR